MVTGGGHIASIRRLDSPDVANPLWEPPWPTVDPSLRKLTSSGGTELEGRGFKFADPLEGSLLTSICGHSVCADVFGSHSPGEVAQGLSFHGEAGLVTWEVVSVKREDSSLELTMRALLPVSQLELSRVFCLRVGSLTVSVQETLKNLTKFQRALGVAQHVTVGEAWLKQGCDWACNADKGRTWPEPVEESSLVSATEFLYPTMPGKQQPVDWTVFPRGKAGEWASESNLAALRVDPKDGMGWFACQARAQGREGESWTLLYMWNRKDFPWLVTWEECNARGAAPWNKRTLARGLEFSSYCLPVSRQWNVSQGSVFDTPAFQWLDGSAERTTVFHLTLQNLSATKQTLSTYSAPHAFHKDVVVVGEKNAKLQ